jgi:hypothetical protein
MAAALTFTDTSLQKSLARYAAARRVRGRTDQDTLRKVMKEWLFLAWEKIPAGNKPKIQANLMQIVTKYKAAGKRRSKSKAANEMRGTLAMHIIMKLNYGGVREAAPKGGWQTDAPYRIAKRFVKMRLFSSNMHRAGLFKGFDLVHGRPGGGGPRYRKAPIGSADESLGNQLTEILVENWASSKGGIGISGLAGDAFEATAAAVATRFRQFAIEDELVNAQKYGVPLVISQ